MIQCSTAADRRCTAARNAKDYERLMAHAEAPIQWTFIPLRRCLGILVLVVGPLVALLWLIVYRITFELVMVIFRIGSDAHAIRDRSDLRYVRVPRPGPVCRQPPPT